MTDNAIMIVDEQSLKDKIYTVRGVQVMFDFDLAEIYGYNVSAFNHQVKRNIERFPEEILFRGFLLKRLSGKIGFATGNALE